MLRLSILTTFLALISVTVCQKCYGLDGNALDNTFAPCNPDAKHSGCCAINRTTSPDLCLDNGLCMSTTNQLLGTIWQNGCTDATGKDEACPRMCPDITNNFNGSNPVPSWNIQMCDYGKYCCRALNDQRSCCNNATAPRVTTTYVGAFQAASVTSEPTRVVATAVSTGNPFDATAAPDADHCQKERQATAIVGGTIGAVFAAIILVLAAIIFWMYKRERRQRKLKEHYEEQFSQTNAYRKALASSAGSIRESVFMDDIKLNSSRTD
ncbi:hypothetical protein IQ07DRAFT_266882 [Pyrenochaeta sp. DS3sAY3a]|nr:hypothetical protein IQ07DRAFT_266882 [Pyrenochaeta sp. DS3sAY3a]